MNTYKTESDFLKTISHATRIAILDILRDGEHCVCHMEAHLGFRQAYISQQLMVLREAGLIQDRREGWNVFYRVTEPRIFAILAAVEQIIPAENESVLNRPVAACSCPKCSAG